MRVGYGRPLRSDILRGRKTTSRAICTDDSVPGHTYYGPPESGGEMSVEHKAAGWAEASAAEIRWTRRLDGGQRSVEPAKSYLLPSVAVYLLEHPGVDRERPVVLPPDKDEAGLRPRLVGGNGGPA